MIGTTVSHYKIIEKLGEGGMGIVYKAEDTKLHRSAALKFLPEHVSSSEADIARFMQEAQAAASLSHPNICTIYGVEEFNGNHFIAMEFVDGRTLKDRQSTLTQKQVLDIGIQVAEGLAAAHEKGVVHRDIKPDNIMIRKDGIAQIMDFGLAKLRGVSRLTKEGSTVGTAGYMSPEQVQGQDTDHRSDIFSLGVLLYELFTGQLPFKGVHETALAYEIVNVDSAPMSSIKPEIPAELDAIILECLEKDPNERAQSARQVAIDLKRFKRESGRSRVSRVGAPVYRSAATMPVKTDRRPTSWIPWSLAAFGFAGMIILAVLDIRHPGASSETIVSSILPPKGANFDFYGDNAGPVVISPDGQWLAFTATDSVGVPRLYVRRLKDDQAIQLAETEGGKYPFWSPDSRFIGFFKDGKLRKVEPSGGPSVVISDAVNGRGGSWNKDGLVLFATTATSPLFVVPASGGEVRQVTTKDSIRKEQTHRWPYFLPDGNHFLYQARTAVTGAQTENDAIRIASLDGKMDRILVATSSNAAYADGRILFMRGNTLVSQKFDTGNLNLIEDAVSVAEGVLNDAGYNLAVFSVSQNGILVFQQGDAQAGSRLVLCNAAGKQIKEIGDVTEFYTPRISPDGKRIATGTFDAKSRNQDIWLYEIDRGIRTRFTFSLEVEFMPIWSPDGSKIVFNSQKGGASELCEKSATGAGDVRSIYVSSQPKNPTDWSPDGRTILFDCVSDRSSNDNDIGVLHLTDSGQRPTASFFLAEPFDELDAVFSPDGKWVAYTSDESGQEEVYVRPFPGPGGKWQISVDGGSHPRWPVRGNALYYVSRKMVIMAATVVEQASSITVKSVRPLFQIRPIKVGTMYDVTPDGTQFIVNARIDPVNSAPVTIVTNWLDRLNK